MQHVTVDIVGKYVTEIEKLWKLILKIAPYVLREYSSHLLTFSRLCNTFIPVYKSLKSLAPILQLLHELLSIQKLLLKVLQLLQTKETNTTIYQPK